MLYAKILGDTITLSNPNSMNTTMNTTYFFALLLSLSVLLSVNVRAQDITLPAPQKTGGKPLFDAISERHSTRDFTEKEIPLQELSNILWSAYGFNRTDMRVIPTPNNRQQLSVYVFLKNGVYLYDAAGNKLIKKADGDHRRKVGAQDYVYGAPVNILYTADSTKGGGNGAAIPAGCAVQDVYLVCASQGIGCVVRTSGMDASALRPLLKLPATEELIVAQTLGYAKTE
jgi:nitroreductase